MSVTQFRITNITCDACVKLSTVVLQKIPGVTQVAVEQSTGSVTLSADRTIPWEEITTALQSVGKVAVPAA